MSEKYLLARTVAQAMTHFLERNETSIHWVQVIGEDSLVTKPSKAWPVVNDLTRQLALNPTGPCCSIWTPGLFSS